MTYHASWVKGHLTDALAGRRDLLQGQNRRTAIIAQGSRAAHLLSVFRGQPIINEGVGVRPLATAAGCCRLVASIRCTTAAPRRWSPRRARARAAAGTAAVPGRQALRQPQRDGGDGYRFQGLVARRWTGPVLTRSARPRRRWPVRGQLPLRAGTMPPPSANGLVKTTTSDARCCRIVAGVTRGTPTARFAGLSGRVVELPPWRQRWV